MHHSGYDLPPYRVHNQPRAHDAHHRFFDGNYGTIGLMDWLHGTFRDAEKDEESMERAFRKMKEPEK